MDIDGPSSSPPLRHTSLPPSSAPDPTSSNGRNGTPKRPRQTNDALAFDDADREDGEEEVQGTRRRARPRQGQLDGNIPIVKDAVGESVRESFEAFLKTYVSYMCPTHVLQS